MSHEIDLAADRWLRIMADYGAEGVWDRDDVSRGAEELPVPADLVARIERWGEWYWDSDHDDGFDPAFPVEAFAAEGLAIARAIKAALPDWTVIYLDEAKLRDALAMKLDATGVPLRKPPRSTYEYEITLPEAPPAP